MHFRHDAATVLGWRCVYRVKHAPECCSTVISKQETELHRRDHAVGASTEVTKAEATATEEDLFCS